MADESKKGTAPIKLSDFHKSLTPPGKFADLGIPKGKMYTIAGGSSGRFTGKIPIPEPTHSFGGEKLHQFFRALNSARFIEFLISELPMDDRVRVAWTYRFDSRHSYRMRGRTIRPIVEFTISVSRFRFLADILRSREIIDLRATKGAIILFLYLGFCSAEGDFFNSHRDIFSVDYDLHENNYVVLMQQILGMVEERLLDPSIWALQKEAEKMFLDCFI